jgi:putative transposase
MRKSKYSETQIVAILRDAGERCGGGRPATKARRQQVTFFKRRSKYGGASVSDLRRLRELQVENAKLKGTSPSGPRCPAAA